MMMPSLLLLFPRFPLVFLTLFLQLALLLEVFSAFLLVLLLPSEQTLLVWICDQSTCCDAAAAGMCVGVLEQDSAEGSSG